MALTDKLKAIADSIRLKTQTTGKMTLDEMPTLIESIHTGSDPILQEKTVSPTESLQEVVYDSGYTGLSKVNVNAISSTYVGSGVARKTSADLTVSGATVSVPSGYYASNSSKAVSNGSVTLNAPTVNSNGLVTSSATVSSGYVSGNPSNKTLQLTTQGAKSITPTKSSQTAVSSGVYTTGTITVNAIPSEYIVPSGSQTIVSNDTYNVASLETVVVNVPQSGGSSKNIQCYHGYATVSATSYTATSVSLTVAKTGTYKVSWMGYRSTNSGTSGSQLYIGTTAYGSANTSFVNTYGQSVVLTNVSLTQGQTITVRARARSTSYVMSVGNLCIEEN